MALVIKQFKLKFLGLLPIILLLFISLNGNSIIDFRFFSVNLHFILVYYWVLRHPEALRYGLIFLSGIISDVVFGLPLGINALALLIVAGAAAYIRAVTVRASLLNDGVSFIPALLLANFVYFISLYFSEFTIDYFYLFKNSISTFIFYPIFWGLFSLLSNLMKS